MKLPPYIISQVIKKGVTSYTITTATTRYSGQDLEAVMRAFQQDVQQSEGLLAMIEKQTATIH